MLAEVGVLHVVDIVGRVAEQHLPTDIGGTEMPTTAHHRASTGTWTEFLAPI